MCRSVYRALLRCDGYVRQIFQSSHEGAFRRGGVSAKCGHQVLRVWSRGIFVLSLYFYSVVAGQAQSWTFEYEFMHVTTVEKAARQKEALKSKELYNGEILKKISELKQNYREYFTLYYEEGQSLFVLKDDEEVAPVDLDGGSITLYNEMREDKVFKDLVSGEFQYKKTKDFEDFFLLGNVRNINWTLHNEVRYIVGLKCQRATYANCFDQVDAWFTTEIPISDGPLYLGGLPGLIVEVSLNNNKRFILTSYNQSAETLQEISVLWKNKKKTLEIQEFCHRIKK